VASALRNRQCQLWSVCLELPLEVRAQSLDDAVQCPALLLQRIAEFLNDGVAGNGNGPPFNRGDVAPNLINAFPRNAVGEELTIERITQPNWSRARIVGFNGIEQGDHMGCWGKNNSSDNLINENNAGADGAIG